MTKISIVAVFCTRREPDVCFKLFVASWEQRLFDQRLLYKYEW